MLKKTGYDEIRSIISVDGGVFRLSLKVRLSPEDEALLGAEFTDDEIEWKVLKVGYSTEGKEVLAWYYNVSEAGAANVSKEKIKLSLEEDLRGHWK